MDIQHLKYFITIAEQQSFTRASKLLFISQPMLTRCIKALETELNLRLIERTSKSFCLTDAGKAFLQSARVLVEQYDDLFRVMEDVKQTRTGEVRISSPGVLLDIYFPALLTEFRKQNPGISISIIEEGSKQTVNSVLGDTVDLGLVMLPVANMSELDVIPVVGSEVCLMVRKDHPFAQKNAVHISELQNKEIITYGDTTTLHDIFIQMCQAEGFYPKIAYKSSMPTFAAEMVSLGSCIGVFPAPVIQRYQSDDLTSVRIDPKFDWEIAIVLKKGRYRSFAATSLIDFIQKYFPAQQ